MAKSKKYILDNGDKITAHQLAEKVGISVTAARFRLKKSTDPKKIYRGYCSVGDNFKKKPPPKVYPIDDPMYILMMRGI